MTNIFYICLLKPPFSRWLNPEVGWFLNVPQWCYRSWSSIFEMVDVTCRLFEASKTRYSKVGRLKTKKEKHSTRWLIGLSNMGQFINQKKTADGYYISISHHYHELFPLVILWAIPCFRRRCPKKKGYLQIIHLEALGVSVINQLLGIPFLETPKWLPELILFINSGRKWITKMIIYIYNYNIL